MEEVKIIKNKWKTIVLIIIPTLLVIGLIIALYSLFSPHKEFGLIVEPSVIEIKQGELGLLTIISRLREPIGNSSVITTSIIFNASNNKYISIINPFTDEEIEELGLEMPNIENGMGLVQVYINASKVEGQKTSNWWLDIILMRDNTTIDSVRVDIVVK